MPYCLYNSFKNHKDIITMTNHQEHSLFSGKPSFSISDLKPEILKLAKERNSELLYQEFIEKFLGYIPVDYRNEESLNPLGDFSGEAFAFYKERKPGTRKIEIKIEDFEGEPAITVLLLNDDKSFIVDSLLCLLTKMNLQPKFILHPVMQSARDNEGKIITPTAPASVKDESFIYMKILGNFERKSIEHLQKEINNVLDYVEDTANSWQTLLDKTANITKEIEASASLYAQHHFEPKEVCAFLEWTQQNNFTFLGALDYKAMEPSIFKQEGAYSIWQENEEELLDIIRLSTADKFRNNLVILGKINRISPVHRDNLVDYILIKRLNEKGEYEAGTILFGLYGTAIYYQSISNIPILREKLKYVLDHSAFSPGGYSYKKLKVTIESLSRDALVQTDKEDLLYMGFHMLSAIVSKKLKLFVQQDWSGSFINILIFLPKTRLTPEMHEIINQYLAETFGGEILSDYVTEIAQSFSNLFITLARKEKSKIEAPLEQIEKHLDLLTTSWNESFYKELCKTLGEYQASVDFKDYKNLFPADFRHNFTASQAIEDIDYLRKASVGGQSTFNLIPLGETNFALKIYSPEVQLALSGVLPLVENLGFKVIDGDSFTIHSSGTGIKKSWIYRFILSVPTKIEQGVSLIKANVEEALHKMSTGVLASDSLGRLIAMSGLNWYQVKILKALTRYLHQTGFTYGKGYVQLTLIKHNKFTEYLISLFDAKFNPKSHSVENVAKIERSIEDYLKTVTSSAEDKVLSTMHGLIKAIVRTNCYQLEGGRVKDYCSFKFNSDKIPGLPLPVPYAEIFVYSNLFEGVHLRGGKVARGGLRWSDRGEDYRVEVHGLMKAQMAKNSVIVPVGSKGGFFIHLSPDGMDKASYMNQVVECYKNFLRGMLDITDNIVGGKIVPPSDTVVYDEEDPYLVVAADKGTASFSDYANSVSAEYNFWLGDAFASGGSAGYDHKKMAITSKGAWISVKRHFDAMGIDVEEDPITMVGIGDMSGDVFGNGMLRAKTIKLVAAFNHKHIFLDPNPDLKESFIERQRLFDLPGSQWTDYNPKLISKGGGIFERAAKMIALSPEIKALLEIEPDEIVPDDLIRAIIKAKVDVIWNGGIGTYIKASTENNIDIGDKANDNLRCNAGDVRARAIAEGGNLGISQRGRIEFSKQGGHINTDFIDNSGGVDCSDHEVNIKIALGSSIASGTLTLEDRNKLLVDMTDEVEELVLDDNYKQTKALTITELSSAFTLAMHARLIEVLEETKLLDRAVEFLPNATELQRRIVAKEHMTSPELAVLLSYSKMFVSKDLGNSELLQDPYFESYLLNYFPVKMRERFRSEILAHPLRREIIVTVLTNKIVNQLGGSIISNINYETGASLSDIARSYTIVCDIFNLDALWQKVELLPARTDIKIKIDMFTELAKIMRRGISWFVKNLEGQVGISQTIEQFKQPAAHLSKTIGEMLVGEAKNKFDERLAKYKEAGIAETLAYEIASLDNLVSAFDIMHISAQTQAKDIEVAGLYFITAYRFSLDWLRKECEKHMNDSYWNRLSIQSLKDDLYEKQRRLLVKIIEKSKESINLDLWLSRCEKDASIFFDFIEDIKVLEATDINMIILANKKLELFLRKL